MRSLGGIWKDYTLFSIAFQSVALPTELWYQPKIESQKYMYFCYFEII